MFTVVLDKERHAKVNTKALRLFREKTGMDVMSPKAGEQVDLEVVEKLLWVSLLHEDPALTLETVQDNVEFFQLKQFLAYFAEGKLPGNFTQ